MFDPIFPGMDPFIEDQRWTEFHNALIARIHNELSRLLVPLYSVQADSYIHLHIRPDVSIFRGKQGTEPLERASIKAFQPTRLITPTLYEEDEQQRIEIRDVDGKLVTVLEILYPANKERHRDRYLANRDAILYSDVNLVEFDLLRGGKRMEPSLPSEGYLILVARARENEAHLGEVYEIGLRDSLPVIPVPLVPGEADVPLDLPKLFQEVYVAARYRLQLNYTYMPLTPFSSDDRNWIHKIIQQAQE